MTVYEWEDILSEQDQAVIDKAGYAETGASTWESRGLGERPMVLVIDMQQFIVGRDVPILDAMDDHRAAMGEIAWRSIDDMAPFLEFARERDVPIGYTRVVPMSYDDPEHEDLQVVDPIAPQEGDLVIDKNYASAFYGTALVSELVRRDRDSLIIVGNSTSGCVRASTVDAQSNGFDVIIPQECVFDRIQASHKAALLDMWMKYAEVLEVEQVRDHLRSITD